MSEVPLCVWPLSGDGPRSRRVRFWGMGLVFKAHRLVYHSTLGWRVIKKKKEEGWHCPLPSEAGTT